LPLLRLRPERGPGQRRGFVRRRRPDRPRGEVGGPQAAPDRGRLAPGDRRWGVTPPSPALAAPLAPQRGFLRSRHAPCPRRYHPHSTRLRMRLTLISRALAAFLLAAVAFAGQVQAQDGGAVLDRLRAKYESLDALRARFTQTVGGEVTEGTLVFRGDQYRIETGNQTLVTDGR